MQTKKQKQSWFHKGPEWRVSAVLSGREWIKQGLDHARGYAPLLEEHLPVIRSRLHALRRDFGKDLTRVEFGLTLHKPVNTRGWVWPYAAIERRSSDGAVLFSTMLVPCGWSGGLRTHYRIPPREVYYAGIEAFMPWVAVIPDVTELTGPTVALTGDQLGLRDVGVQDSDCWVCDTLHCPTVNSLQGRETNRPMAANFGDAHEMLDLVQGRLTFACLPSA
jgi:hypothetical protein